jgi:hydrogenase expression/formation protein HypE
MTDRRLHLQDDYKVMLAHGGGGALTDELLSTSIFPRLSNPLLNELLDSGIVKGERSNLAITIDGYVVQPLEFPGGDIGRLAVCGTVNDLAVCGAKPLGIALSMILCEGLDRKLLERIVDSIAKASKEAGVSVVTGDTKVIGSKSGDGMYLTTAGVGEMGKYSPHPKHVKTGDRILINGPIADHGLAVMLAREMPQVKSVIKSDAAPLNGLIAKLLEAVPGVKFMRDATRGGLAGVATDLATRTGLKVVFEETKIPINSSTLHAAEMLGLDPLEVANEGKIVVVVSEGDVEKALQAMRSMVLGIESEVIGRIEQSPFGACELETTIGGRRILQKPYGEQLPRIC